MVHLTYQVMYSSHLPNNKLYTLLLITLSKKSISKLTSQRLYPLRPHIKLHIWLFHLMGLSWLLLIRLVMLLFSISKDTSLLLSSISRVLLSLRSSVLMESYSPLHNNMASLSTDHHVYIVHSNPLSLLKSTKIVTPLT